MSADPTDSTQPPRPVPADDVIHPACIPIASAGGIRFSVSYGVFIALAILFGVVFNETRRAGNADLPLTALAGVGFWVSGWLVQAITYLGISKFLATPTLQMTFGVMGVAGYPRRWSASCALAILLAPIVAVALLGTCYFLLSPDRAMGFGPWETPSFGLSMHDHVWRAAGWLCWIQVAWQVFPLPTSLGRQLIGASVSIIARSSDIIVQRRLSMGLIATVGVATVALAAGQWALGDSSSPRAWLWVVVLGSYLIVTARGRDLGNTLVAFKQYRETRADVGIRDRLAIVWRKRRSRRRLEAALQQERQEAVDAKRLDEVLTRLHQSGPGGLSRADRELLERVSSNLRKNRITLEPPPEARDKQAD